MKTDSKFRWLLLILLMLVIGISYFVNRSSANSSDTENSERKADNSGPVVPKKEAVAPIEPKNRLTLTIDGYDADSKSIIQRINLWDNYETRARIVGQVSHGEEVVLIKRVGDGVYVETRSGLKGWLTYWFIKEYDK